MAAEGVFPKSDGDTLFGSDVNILQNNGAIDQIYTGSGFNSTGGSTGTHELTAITAAELNDSDYLEIIVTSTSDCDANSGSASTVLQIETKDVGGSYSDTFNKNPITATATDRTIVTTTITWIHTLTANEKTNGVQVRMNSISSEDGTGEATFTNIQTVIKTGILLQ